MSTVERAADAASPSAADGAHHSALYAAYALFVLIIAYIVAFIDRQILGLLVEPIKHDLSLSDTQISLLHGLSFALFLSLAGLPIGRLIDTGRRITILSIGIAFWSFATAGCGLARNFITLLLCRIGVGAGESVMTPSAYSLIGDYFPPHRLGLAAGIYSMGAHVGTGLALIFGAALVSAIPTGTLIAPFLGEIHGWQLVFLLMGPIGLIAACLVATLREPKRGGKTHAPNVSLGEAARYFAAHWRPLVLVNVAVGCIGMAAYGLNAWAPTLFIRKFGWSVGEIGVPLGLIAMIAGATGTFSAGLIGDALRARGLVNGRIWTMLAAAVIAAPLSVLAASAASAEMLLALLAPLNFFVALAIGSGPATLQEITPNRLRGMQHAFAVLAANILGLGCGPTLVALVTDYVFHDEMKLAQSLVLVLPSVLAAAAIMAMLALRPYKNSVASLAASEA